MHRYKKSKPNIFVPIAYQLSLQKSQTEYLKANQSSSMGKGRWIIVITFWWLLVSSRHAKLCANEDEDLELTSSLYSSKKSWLVPSSRHYPS